MNRMTQKADRFPFIMLWLFQPGCTSRLMNVWRFFTRYPSEKNNRKINTHCILIKKGRIFLANSRLQFKTEALGNIEAILPQNIIIIKHQRVLDEVDFIHTIRIDPAQGIQNAFKVNVQPQAPGLVLLRNKQHILPISLNALENESLFFPRKPGTRGPSLEIETFDFPDLLRRKFVEFADQIVDFFFCN